MDAALVSPESEKKEPARWGGWRPNSGRPRRLDWQEAFLIRVAECGARYRAAADVGVDAKTVTAELERNADFADAYAEARQIYADDLEILLRDQGDGTVRGNPLPVFALLKKHRPHEYVERHMALTVNVDVEVPPDQARTVLSEMIQHLAPATVERLSAERSDDAASQVLNVSSTDLGMAVRPLAAPPGTLGPQGDHRATTAAASQQQNGIRPLAAPPERRASDPAAPLALPPGELASEAQIAGHPLPPVVDEAQTR